MRRAAYIVFATLLAAAALPARAERLAITAGSPLEPLVIADAVRAEDGSLVVRDGRVLVGRHAFQADATYRRPRGDSRIAFMLRSDSVGLAPLLPSMDRFLGGLFADAAPGAGMLAFTIEGGVPEAYELAWSSRRTWMIDARDSRGIELLKELVTDPEVFSEWDFSQFLVESCTIRVRRVDHAYSPEDASRLFPGEGGREEYVASITLSGTMPAAQGMFRWIRTRVSVHAPNFPIRLVNARWR